MKIHRDEAAKQKFLADLKLFLEAQISSGNLIDSAAMYPTATDIIERNAIWHDWKVANELLGDTDNLIRKALGWSID